MRRVRNEGWEVVGVGVEVEVEVEFEVVAVAEEEAVDPPDP